MLDTVVDEIVGSMNESVANLDVLLEKANELKNGPKRIGLLEEAVRIADELGDIDVRYRTRQKLLEAAVFGGRPDLVLSAFSWSLAVYDRTPNRFDEKDILWKYKWVLGNVVEFPHISRLQIESMLDDMAARFGQAGSTLHGFHQVRREILADMGDRAGSEAAHQLLTATKRDFLSDCRACVHDISTGLMADQGRDAEALAEAAPILAGRVKCAHVPHRTYGRILLPLLRLRQVEEAAACHLKGYRLIAENPEFLVCAGQHLEFLALTGNIDRGIALIGTHLPQALDTPSAANRMRFLAAMWVLLDRSIALGRETLRLQLSPNCSLFNERGVYATGHLIDWCEAETSSLVAQFDARNGNDHYARWFANKKNLKQFAMPAPIEEPDVH